MKPKKKREKPDRKAERLASDHLPLKPEDFDVSVGNDGRIDPKAAREKRQEFSKSMGEFTRNLSASGLTQRDGHYIGGLAEQERRFQNRRTARTVSLMAAHEELHLRRFRAAASEYLTGTIKPTGYASVRRTFKPAKRTVVLFLSDLHIGAELSALAGDPVPFGAVQEARRLEFLLRQALEFKPQYRETSDMLLVLGGDVIEGLLLHDLRDGAPLTEQMVAFWRYFRAFVGYLAQEYPRVRVVCQPGNHGRNKLRHPGRATSSKWDGVEYQLYYGLSMMASSLPNVTFDLGFRALSILDLHGSKVGITHGDTEIKLGHPDTKAKQNRTELAKVNNTRLYGCELAALLAGHFHTPRFQPGRPAMLFNGMMVPPNGHARSQGYIDESCGQWLFEAVEGHPVGDLRYLALDRSQDDDERLGKLIEPFRFSA